VDSPTKTREPTDSPTPPRIFLGAPVRPGRDGPAPAQGSDERRRGGSGPQAGYFSSCEKIGASSSRSDLSARPIWFSTVLGVMPIAQAISL